MRMPTRRMKKRIGTKCWRHMHRSKSGHPPLTLMQVPMMPLRSSQRRKRTLQLRSSSHHGVLVLSHPVVPLTLPVREAQWHEACLPSWPRWQHRSRSNLRLTQLFSLLFAVMCARGPAHRPSTRIHLYALKGMCSCAELLLQCMHVLPFLFWFWCLLSKIDSTTLSVPGLAHSGANKKVFFA